MSGKWDPGWHSQKIKDYYSELLVLSSSGAPVGQQVKLIKKIDRHISEILRRRGHHNTKPYVAQAENTKRRLRRLKKNLGLSE